MGMKEIRQEARERMRALSFGDPVTNVCAGKGNPHRLAYFVRWVNGDLAECTDKRGEFWRVGMEVIFPGHIGEKESDRLFTLIWEAQFGRPRDIQDGIEHEALPGR